MHFTVQQECPQCGGRIELEETDHLIHCPFCRVKNFLFAKDYPRYILPAKSPKKEMIYAPYMRFKGVAFFCSGTSVHHRIVDVTLQGTKLKQLPLSLGLRPQTLKMEFVSPKVTGSFLKNAIGVSDVFANVGSRRSVSGEEKLLHRAYVGETLSCIYSPLYVEKNQVVDAVTNKPLSELPHGDDVFAQFTDTHPEWRITFMPTLCPNCGWDLVGERDSVVLICRNCSTVWEASEGKFMEVQYSVVPGKNERTVYVPFWRITAEENTLPVHSYADFIRVTGQPMMVRQEWEAREMFFCVPAFKIRPGVFLRLAVQATFTQQDFETDGEGLSENVYPITLPLAEAVQALKITLARSTVHEKKVFPLLPQVNFRVKGTNLVFLPFRDNGNELIQEQKGFSILKNALKAGRNL